MRHRWQTSRVIVEDRGDEIVIRPAPDDPIGALEGALSHLSLPTSDTMRREAREEAAALEERRLP